MLKEIEDKIALLTDENGEITDYDAFMALNTEREKLLAESTVALDEESLQLVISNKSLGSLTTNALQIKKAIEAALPNYDVANYNEFNIDMAKADKAMLNNTSKTLNAKRLEIEKQFMEPFAEFKGIITETCSLISACSLKIDGVVKGSEQKAKDEKRKFIEKYWDKKAFFLVPLSKIFDEKWLNKGTKFKAIWLAIDAKIASINDDLITIEAIGEDVELLKSLYIDTLNLNSTIQYAKTLKENRVRAKQEAEDRLKDVEERRAAEEDRELERSIFQHQAPTAKELPKPNMINFTFSVTGTKAQIDTLMRFMDGSKITYERGGIY